MKNQILGTLYGLAIGDAMGMPSELWSRRKVKEYFGKIETFLDGPKSNEVAKHFSKGQYTDDTTQALIILNALMETEFEPNDQVIAEKLIEWAEEIHAFDNEILGPSSKAALLAVKNGKDASKITATAVTNGAAMRIAPIGCLFNSNQSDALINYVWRVSKVTHASDVAITGAAMIAGAISSAMEKKTWEEIVTDTMNIHDKALAYGAETFSPSLKARLELGLEYAHKFSNDEEAFSNYIYRVIGAGVSTSESVPAALSIAYYAKTVERCAILAANLGGDTDTIGAMATAICGAKQGADEMDPSYLQTINDNNKVDFNHYAQALLHYRKN
ncbi:ADP-ribosylglycohydrolase family protein [Virgibacillus proomii]|uniref:ADP-ribosylglycohydrolase family protein n=1 Tax=Virgibacillus proomii TaxID=84407 RepID=UPI001C0F50A0|nr:ADP-ribosylglycohydrolase family protein [Virgibacillus proomii]MBU5267442.1 ADP-ribosylglycohydrolase family protein [Virgibacillus proomii]